MRFAMNKVMADEFLRPMLRVVTSFGKENDYPRYLTSLTISMRETRQGHRLTAAWTDKRTLFSTTTEPALIVGLKDMNAVDCLEGCQKHNKILVSAEMFEQTKSILLHKRDCKLIGETIDRLDKIGIDYVIVIDVDDTQADIDFMTVVLNHTKFSCRLEESTFPPITVILETFNPNNCEQFKKAPITFAMDMKRLAMVPKIFKDAQLWMVYDGTFLHFYEKQESGSIETHCVVGSLDHARGDMLELVPHAGSSLDYRPNRGDAEEVE